MIDPIRAKERKLMSPFLRLATYRHSRESMPDAYWAAVLTPRKLVFTDKKGFSFERYNPHICARQLGIAQACAIPLGDTNLSMLNKRCSFPIDELIKKVARYADLLPIRGLPHIYQPRLTIGFATSWLTTWSQLQDQVVFCYLCPEPIAYDAPSKGTSTLKRKQQTCNLTKQTSFNNVLTPF